MGRGFVFLTAKGAKFSQRNAKLEDGLGDWTPDL